ncbi:DUF4440 domain-containing protein [Paenisporosarcina sp. TG20]|uniref:nuclear transport factor 2 family protein n=1 Tax=Paenisporosarcina sp. TG20 TaxID=1211706 RepID=UPI0002FF3F80|nr:DUF4440 domain-containing protein [Paenisporosarcina sp. TG20]
MTTQLTLKEHLCQLEKNLLQPGIRTSPEELEKYLENDFFEFGSSGKVLYNNGIEAGGIGIVKMTLSNFEIHQLSTNVVLTTYRIYNEVKMQHSLRSSIWKFSDGKWKMFFHQGTPTQSQ